MKIKFLASILQFLYLSGTNSFNVEQLLENLVSSDNKNDHTCISAINRFKSNVVDFKSVIGSHEKYTDPEFKPNKEAIYWSDFEKEGASLAERANLINWERAKDYND